MGPPGDGYGPSEHWSTARNGGGYQYANPYSSTQPGYEAAAYGQCDSDNHGYSSELRALEGNYYDARGPNLGYDDDLKFVGGRGSIPDPCEDRPPVGRRVGATVSVLRRAWIIILGSRIALPAITGMPVPALTIRGGTIRASRIRLPVVPRVVSELIPMFSGTAMDPEETSKWSPD